MLTAELVERVNGLAARGASRLVVAVNGDRGAEQEQRVKRLLLRLYPRHLLGAIPLLFSWELVADRDDPRRTWSALLNAFLHPAMERFLFNAEGRLRQSRTRRPLLIFRNDGGSSRVAKSSALKTYSSGPRGGLEGALARRLRIQASAHGGRGRHHHRRRRRRRRCGAVDRRGRVAMVPEPTSSWRRSPATAWGSSVIRVAGGERRSARTVSVPPRGRPRPGGADATITDVYLCMGVLDPHTYLDGALMLDVERSRKAVMATVAEPLGVGLDAALARMEAAYLDRVAEALRTEPLTADTVIAAFGGAGPMTVCGAAERAGVRQVIIPRTAAVFSAFGIGFSDISQHYEAPLTSLDGDTVADVVGRLRRRAQRDMFAEGVDLGACVERFRLGITRGEQDTLVDLDDPPWPATCRTVTSPPWSSHWCHRCRTSGSVATQRSASRRRWPWAAARCWTAQEAPQNCRSIRCSISARERTRRVRP